MILREVLPSHDRVVDQQDVLAVELERDRVQLAANRGLPLLLVRHDECPPDVAILDEALAIRNVHRLRHRQRRIARAIRNRNDDIRLGRARLSPLLRQRLAKPTATGLVDADLVQEGVRPREVHQLEDARAVLLLDDLNPDRLLAGLDQEGFAVAQIAHPREAGHIERDRFTRDGPLGAFVRFRACRRCRA